ncbi:membrane protein [Spirochaetia bacterium]|nr:membrane protein [Spirochaetia bacterium]
MPLMPQPGKPLKDSRQIIALLGAFCFFLSAVEYLIPKPLPFIRLGLANLPLVLGIDILGFPAFVLLVMLKILGQALISGTLVSYVFIFSFAGTAVSALFMYALRRSAGAKRISLIGVSTAGALTSNAVQLVLARFFIFGGNTAYIAAPILGLGLITGILLGLFCEYFLRQSQWYALLMNNTFTANCNTITVNTSSNTVNTIEKFRSFRQQKNLSLFSANALAITAILMMPAFLFNQDTLWKTLQFLLFWFLAWASGKKNNPFIIIGIVTFITFFNLIVPYGELLYQLGPFRITKGALLAGLRRGITLEGLVMLSRAGIRQDLKLPGYIGELLGESFRLFALLTENKTAFKEKVLEKKGSLFVSLDELLFDLSASSFTPASQTPAKTRTGLRGFIILAAAVILSWLPWLIIQF